MQLVPYRQVFNYVNGALMKSFEGDKGEARAHGREVTHLVYCPNSYAVASAAGDGTLAFHDEGNSRYSCPLMARIHHAHGHAAITALASHGGLLVSGASDGSLKMWDHRSCRYHEPWREGAREAFLGA